MKIDLPTAILALVLALLLAGALLSYPLNPNEYGAKISKDGNTATIEMNSAIESAYEIYSVDLKYDCERELLVYYDESYKSPNGPYTQQDLIQEITEQLKCLNKSYRMIDASEMGTIMDSSSEATKYAILVTSGAFPCNVYRCSGSAVVEDKVTTWMDNGGMVLWYSEYEFGYYSAPLKDDFVDWETDQPLENNSFGLEFDDSVSYGTIRSEISSILSLNQNVCEEFSVKGTSSDIVNLGYESDDGRYSIAFAKYGNGGAVINGGTWEENLCFAKIIASAVYDWANYNVEHKTGTFKGTEKVDLDITGSDAVFVWLGTLMPRYGELFLL